MTRANRDAVLAALLVAAGALFGVGCGSQACNNTPNLSSHPSACTAPPGGSLTVTVRWCDCGAATTCEVLPESGGVIQLEPKVAVCDASCPANSSSCPYRTVDCTFVAPIDGSYNLYLIDGQSFQNVPLTVSDGAPATCM